jgi:hypothetical protein
MVCAFKEKREILGFDLEKAALTTNACMSQLTLIITYITELMVPVLYFWFMKLLKFFKVGIKNNLLKFPPGRTISV